MLGEDMCRALLFWYALTGCDTVSTCLGKGKLTAWNTWLTFPEVTDIFIKLSQLIVITDQDRYMIEQFVVVMYDRSCPYTTVEQCCKYLFTQRNQSIENYHLTRDALLITCL